MEKTIDIKENYICQLDSKLLAVLLQDKSSGKNIIWATDNYAERGFGYQSSDQITIDCITHRNGSVIKPRTAKSKKGTGNPCPRQGRGVYSFLGVQQSEQSCRQRMVWQR